MGGKFIFRQHKKRTRFNRMPDEQAAYRDDDDINPRSRGTAESVYDIILRI
jgi:hypothetical protein